MSEPTADQNTVGRKTTAKRPRRPLGRRLAIALLSFAGMGLVVFGALEIGFRVFAPAAAKAKVVALQQALEDSASTDFVSHAYSSHVRAPREGVNRDGFIGADRPVAKPAGVKRIACVGGSTTETYPALLEQVLKRRARERVEVLNFGMAAWSSAESLANLLLHAQDFAPDIVIIHNVVNDVWARVYPDYTSDYRHWRRPTVFAERAGWFTRTIGRHSQLYLWAMARTGAGVFDLMGSMSKPRPAGLDLDVKRDLDPESAFAYRRNLETMIRVARGVGARAFLMTMPYDSTETGGVMFAEVIRDHNRIMRELAAETKAGLIDLDPVFTGRSEVFADLVHFVPEQLGLKAEHIAEALLESGALSRR